MRRECFPFLSVRVQSITSCSPELTPEFKPKPGRKTQTKTLLSHMILPFCGGVTMSTESTEPPAIGGRERWAKR